MFLVLPADIVDLVLSLQGAMRAQQWEQNSQLAP
jgi:hypothetical protein